MENIYLFFIFPARSRSAHQKSHALMAGPIRQNAAVFLAGGENLDYLARTLNFPLSNRSCRPAVTQLTNSFNSASWLWDHQCSALFSARQNQSVTML